MKLTVQFLKAMECGFLLENLHQDLLWEKLYQVLGRGQALGSGRLDSQASVRKGRHA